MLNLFWLPFPGSFLVSTSWCLESASLTSGIGFFPARWCCWQCMAATCVCCEDTVTWRGKNSWNWQQRTRTRKSSKTDVGWTFFSCTDVDIPHTSPFSFLLSIIESWRYLFFSGGVNSLRILWPHKGDMLVSKNFIKKNNQEHHFHQWPV